ncbi:histidine--tRNA ligase [Flavobacterium rakeshii]|uniref:Histidine--tRNA ligase n=1 Tax=Flavobacterium rakeshii TaxID=1038845 RepID=A0A6N8HB20_9FLAO|nr:histidine--tRNA ligase [Flavobacterium rakeshii]MUV03143.1 histidine--tRNA ligase [Flavobacterium rakeshii]
MAQKPGIPKGTRDFSPAEVAKRQYIISAIKHHFETFGFQPIETPTFENSSTLMGKYGEEGDRLIFKILNSGDYLKNNEVLLQDKILLDSVLDGFFVRLYNDLTFKSSVSIKTIHDKFSESEINSIDNWIEGNILDLKNKLESLEEQTFKKNSLKNLIIDNKNEIFKSALSIIKKISLNLNWESDFNRLKMMLLTNKGCIDFSSYYASQISEKALRYDLTVPFARYVVQHQNDIVFPFKRYQIQPVWRADKPQKSRYREFYQCDADVVGSKSLWQEVEFVQLYDGVFTSLGLNGVTIKINNRKILSGIAEVIGAKDKLIDFTVALDKLDKIGEDGVKKEMLEKGIGEDAIQKVQPLFNFTGSINEKLDKLNELLATSEEGLKGVEELRFICDNVAAIGLGESTLDLDVTLARGLNYYTGAIFEVSAPAGVKIGSIGGGGRYDDLTGIFGLKNMSGVGISFGLDRIYDVIEELNLFPDTVTESTKVLFINFGDKESLYAMKAVKQLRGAGIKSELYPDSAKVGKQFQHADKRGIPFAVLTGDEEINNNTFTLKNLATGEQEQVSLEELKNKIQ